jgi:hypothetical protein
MHSGQRVWPIFSGSLLSLGGLVLGYFAIRQAWAGNYTLAFIFIIYLLVVLTLVTVYRDAQKFLSTGLPRRKGQVGMAEDYLSHLNWHATFSRRSYRNEPRWNYQPVYQREKGGFLQGCLTALGLVSFSVVAVSALVAVYWFFRDNLVLLVVSYAIMGLLGLSGYLFWQERKS